MTALESHRCQTVGDGIALDNGGELPLLRAYGRGEPEVRSPRHFVHGQGDRVGLPAANYSVNDVGGSTTVAPGDFKGIGEGTGPTKSATLLELRV